MSGKTILYVEDNEPNRMIVRDLLKRTSYNLIEAHDGGAAAVGDVDHHGDVAEVAREPVLVVCEERRSGD